jgi:hypothetical protein
MTDEKSPNVLDALSELDADDVRVSDVSAFVAVLRRDVRPPWIYRGQALMDDPVPVIDRIRTSGVYLTPRSRVRSETIALEDFKRLSRPYLSVIPDDDNDLEWMAVARHHRLPTRLLDWSENALAALFFAVEQPNDNNNSVVYGYQRPLGDLTADGRSWSFNEKTRLMVYRPPYIAPRITAQSAVFTVHGAEFHRRSDETGEPIRAWPEAWPGKKITIQIPAAARVPIREQLSGLGIHRASMFPDADGVAEHIKLSVYGASDQPTSHEKLAALAKGRSLGRP